MTLLEQGDTFQPQTVTLTDAISLQGLMGTWRWQSRQWEIYEGFGKGRGKPTVFAGAGGRKVPMGQQFSRGTVIFIVGDLVAGVWLWGETGSWLLVTH